VVDPAKIFLASSLIAMQNLVVVSLTVSAHVPGPNNCGDDGARSLGMGAWLTSQKHATPQHVLAQKNLFLHK